MGRSGKRAEHRRPQAGGRANVHVRGHVRMSALTHWQVPPACLREGLGRDLGHPMSARAGKALEMFAVNKQNPFTQKIDNAYLLPPPGGGEIGIIDFSRRNKPVHSENR